MASRFDEDAAQLFGEMNGYAGEPVRIEPQAARQIRLGGGITNGSRPVRTVTGIFTKAPNSAPLEGARRGGDGRGNTNFMGFDAGLWLSAEVYASLGYDLKTDDVIVLLDRLSERWKIAKAGPATDAGDITIGLSLPGDAP